MIPPLFRRPPSLTIAALYGAIVAQARDARFYARYGVPDTVLGRFDMIVLHVALLLRRLRDGDERQRALAQGVFDAFCRDMDHNLREMGISDPGVPRQMRRVGEAFYGRAQAYDAALAGSDEALAEALARNVYAGVPNRGLRPSRRRLCPQAGGELAGSRSTFCPRTVRFRSRRLSRRRGVDDGKRP